MFTDLRVVTQRHFDFRRHHVDAEVSHDTATEKQADHTDAGTPQRPVQAAVPAFLSGPRTRSAGIVIIHRHGSSLQQKFNASPLGIMSCRAAESQDCALTREAQPDDPAGPPNCIRTALNDDYFAAQQALSQASQTHAPPAQQSQSSTHVQFAHFPHTPLPQLAD
jgi:hypothetical protein